MRLLLFLGLLLVSSAANAEWLKSSSPHFVVVAYNPHNSALANRALQALARLEKDPAWDGKGGQEAASEQGLGQGASAP